jgi:hypothetical protein
MTAPALIEFEEESELGSATSKLTMAISNATALITIWMVCPLV